MQLRLIAILQRNPYKGTFRNCSFIEEMEVKCVLKSLKIKTIFFLFFCRWKFYFQEVTEWIHRMINSDRKKVEPSIFLFRDFGPHNNRRYCRFRQHQRNIFGLRLKVIQIRAHVFELASATVMLAIENQMRFLGCSKPTSSATLFIYYIWPE